MVLEKLGNCKPKKKKNLDTNLTHFTKINSKLIVDLNVKCKTIKLLEDKKEKLLDDLEYDNDFLDTMSKV